MQLLTQMLSWPSIFLGVAGGLAGPCCSGTCNELLNRPSGSANMQNQEDQYQRSASALSALPRVSLLWLSTELAASLLLLLL